MSKLAAERRCFGALPLARSEAYLMDINYYLAREQIERMRADRAASEGARAAHQGLADIYRRLLDWVRDSATPPVAAAN